MCIKKLLKCDENLRKMIEKMTRNYTRMKEVESLELVTKYRWMGQPLTNGEFFLCMWGRYWRGPQPGSGYPTPAWRDGLHHYQGRYQPRRIGQPLTNGAFFQCMWGHYDRGDRHWEAGFRHRHGEMGYVTIRVDN